MSREFPFFHEISILSILLWTFTIATQYGVSKYFYFSQILSIFTKYSLKSEPLTWMFFINNALRNLHFAIITAIRFWPLINRCQITNHTTPIKGANDRHLLYKEQLSAQLFSTAQRHLALKWTKHIRIDGQNTSSITDSPRISKWIFH